MKKLLTILIIMFFTPIFAAQKIYTVKDGTKLKCTAARKSGTIPELNKPVVDYYEFKNGKIYSRNMLDQFAHFKYMKKRDAYKVAKLKIEDDKITFKDYLYSHEAYFYKWVTINRNNGNYYFKARKNFRHAIFVHLNAEAMGKCNIVK